MKLLDMVKLAGGALVAFSLQSAAAGWEPGPCGSGPCFEYQDASGWHHFNTAGSHTDIWHGPNPNWETNTFEFCGPSRLSCSIINASCNLCLEGQVKKFQDASGQWRIGVKVVGGEVTGGGLCGNGPTDGIRLGGFPWFAGDSSTHTGFGESTGIPYPTPLTMPISGNMGQINIIALGGLLNVTGHVHNVDFYNADPGNPSYFQFDSDLLNSSDGSLGCSVTSLSPHLEVQSPVIDVNIR